MKKSRLFALPLLLATLALTACGTGGGSRGDVGAPQVSNAPKVTHSAAPTKVSTPALKTTPASIPTSGLYLVNTGEPGTAHVSVVHYFGGKSVKERQNAANYKTQELTVKVPSVVKVELKNLSQVSQVRDKDNQLLGCDFAYNGQYRRQTNPFRMTKDTQDVCFSTGFANTAK